MTPSSGVGSGGAAEQQPESEVVSTEPEYGSSAQRPPLDYYAYCYSLKLDAVLRDYEIGLAEATRQYESECQKEAWRSGWLSRRISASRAKGRRIGSRGGKEFLIAKMKSSSRSVSGMLGSAGSQPPALLDGSRPLPCAIVG